MTQAQALEPSIPAILRSCPQWVVWRREERDGKDTKVPYIPSNGSRASSTDPQTWGTYDAARARIDVDGVGFVFSASDPFCGIDLDNCFDDAGNLHPEAEAIVTALDSYTERSPSGKGLHIIVKGKLNGGKNRTGNTSWGGVFEVYDSSRYFTMTGDVVGDRRAIADRQPQLDEVVARLLPVAPQRERVIPTQSLDLTDTELIEKASAATNGHRFAALWRGDTSGYSSGSEADLALCGFLGFWTGGDEARMDRLFRASGLYREKWEREDYREKTLEKALSGRTEFYSATPNPISAETEMLNEMETQFRREERVPGDLLESLAKASSEDEIFDILGDAAPPTSRLARQQVRGRLVQILKERFEEFGSAVSSAKTADAWLKDGSGDELQGRSFVPEDTPPWQAPVQGGEVLDAVVEVLDSFSYQSEENLHAAALWTVHSHCFDAFGISPILQIRSATKRCGKTSTLIPILRLSNRGLLSSNISPASLYRAVEAWQPTLCIDEADTFMKMSDEHKGLLNAGHSRDTAFTLRAEGDANEPRMFSTWAPKAVAGIGHLPDTVEDRSISLVVRRKPTEIHKADAFDSEMVKAVCEPARRRIARWVLDNGDALATTKPERPEGLNDRAWNNWKPLLTIATVAGGEWPERARKAALALSGADADDDLTTLVLRHIKAVFKDGDKLPTREILEALVERDDAPWAKWWADDVGAGRTKAPASRLAKLLKGLDIASEQIRFGDTTARGYRRESFDSAWETYAPGSWETYAADIVKEEGEGQRAPSLENNGTNETNETQAVFDSPDVPSVPSVPSSEGKAISHSLPVGHRGSDPANTKRCSGCNALTFSDDALCLTCRGDWGDVS